MSFPRVNRLEAQLNCRQLFALLPGELTSGQQSATETDNDNWGGRRWPALVREPSPDHL
jgi:hypothetical protein